MKAYGYIRCSTNLQSTEGVTLQNQAQRIQDWCKANGHELVSTFEDAGQSGSNLTKREGLKQALEAVKAAKGILVVYSLSRLSRNIVHASQIMESLQRSDASLASISEQVDLSTASGKLYFNLMLCFAQNEKVTLQERVKSAMSFKRMQLKKIGTVPMGWDCKDGENLTPNEAEQKTLSLILDLSAKGKSLKQIVEALEAHGYPTKRGGAWKRESVRQIIKRNQFLKVAA